MEDLPLKPTNHSRNQGGYVLITVLIALAVMALLGTTALGWALTGLRLSRQAVESEQAFYMANAGIEHALARVLGGQEPGSFDYQQPAGSGVAGTYSVTMTAEPDHSITVVSTGQVGATRRVVTARMLPGASGSEGGGGGGGSQQPAPARPPAVPDGVYAQAIFSNGSLSLRNTATVCGDLYVVGTVSLGNNDRVLGTVKPPCESVVGTGKVVASELVTLENNVVVEGGWCDSLRFNQPGHPCPTRPAADPLPGPNYAALYSQASVRIEGDLTLSGMQTYDNAIVYVTGNLLVSRQGAAISGAVTYAVNGDVFIDGNLSCAGSCAVGILSQGGMTVEHNADVRATLVTRRSLVLGNHVTLRGNIQAGSMSTGNSPVIYPLGGSGAVPPGTPPGVPALTGWSN